MFGARETILRPAYLSTLTIGTLHNALYGRGQFDGEE
jgi:hypothetical protein